MMSSHRLITGCIAVLALASMLIGNFGALAQSNVRRLLAYSAIAHAGSLLLGVIAAGRAGPGPVFYYAATYGLATVGIFGVIAVVDVLGPGGEGALVQPTLGVQPAEPVVAPEPLLKAGDRFLGCDHGVTLVQHGRFRAPSSDRSARAARGSRVGPA